MRLKLFLQKTDILLSIITGIALTLLGIYALYFFIVRPLAKHLPPDSTEIVLALGILSIGVTLLMATYIRTKTMRYFGLANLTFWFFSYGVAFNLQQYMLGSYRGWDGPVQSLALLSLTALFSVLSYRHRQHSK